MTPFLSSERFHIVRARLRSTAAVTLPRPFYDSTQGPFSKRAFASITLIDDDGAEGECILEGSDSVDPLCSKLVRMGPASYEAIYDTLYWSIRNTGFRGGAASTVGAIDKALHVLEAKRRGLPLHRFFGAEVDEARSYASGGSVRLSESELVLEMRGYVERGFGALKIKVGAERGRRMEEDVARVFAVRRAIGENVRLAVDANQVWSAAEAIEFARRIEAANIAWFEEPVHSADLVALEQYCRASSIPAAVGESERSAKVFPSLVSAGARYLQPQPEKLAGVSEWFSVAELAKRHHLALTTPGAPHLGAAFVAAAVDLETEPLAEILFPLQAPDETFFARAPRLVGEVFELSSEPGLPMVIDWDRLEREGRVGEEQVWPK